MWRRRRVGRDGAPVAWPAIDWGTPKKPTFPGLLTGAVAGLDAGIDGERAYAGVM